MNRVVEAARNGNYRQVSKSSRRIIPAVFVVVLLAGAVEANAEVVAYFNFDDVASLNNGTTVVTSHNAVSTPTLDMVEDGVSGLKDQDGFSGNPGGSAGWNLGVLATNGEDFFNDDYFILSVDTTGYEDLTLAFDYRSTNSTPHIGPSQLKLEYSVGSGWNALETLTSLADNIWHVYSKDLSAVDATTENNSALQIRGTWSTDAVQSGSGRLDDLTLTGMAVPEPSSLVLLMAGILGLVSVVARHHRNK